jgi:hypothetical protein
MQGCSLLLGYP